MRHRGRGRGGRASSRAMVWGVVAAAALGWLASRAVRADATTRLAAPPAPDARRADDGRAQRLTFRGATYDVYEVDLDSVRLELFWRDGQGTRIGSLGRLRRQVEARGRRLVFAMNAGMFHPSFEPVGLYVENGRELAPLELATGKPGNFYLRPNGVFFVADGRAALLESAAFARRGGATDVTLATQSGPMLVHGGVVHRAFRSGSTHRNLRNGVGVLPGNRVVFAISNQPVGMHDFAQLFRQRLGCRDALYLDGAVSRMHLPALGRRDERGNFGPIVAVTAPR